VGQVQGPIVQRGCRQTGEIPQERRAQRATPHRRRCGATLWIGSFSGPQYEAYMYSSVFAALDGSDFALWAGSAACDMARALHSDMIICHVYDAGLHGKRFRDLEPVLPASFQEGKALESIRAAHESLILEGFHALSRGYLEDFRKRVNLSSLCVHEIHTEGRNYSRILELAAEHKVSLLSLGAHGLGRIGDDELGSTTMRVLRHASCDVLVVRTPPPWNGPILAGIDGSEHSMMAFRKALLLGRTLNRPVETAAVYDPLLHEQVFRAMSRSLSPDRCIEIGLTRQEELHETIIDSGLARLYGGFLDRTCTEAEGCGMKIQGRLLKGKAYDALLKQAETIEAALLVVGRHGHHRQGKDQLGSNTEALVRKTRTNVLVVGSSPRSS